MKHIVILGGSFAGISTAHRILKNSAKTGPFKITLVSPNTHAYWNIASPRGVIPGQINDETLFKPIASGFSRYPASQFEFILGSAESLDVDAKKVGISGATGNHTLDYDFLILATGSSTMGGTPFKGLGSTEETKNALHEYQMQVKKAKTIVVAGAGVTGVEAAGELGYEYNRQKEIILIASGPTVLPEQPESLQKTVTQALQNLKVDIQLSTKILNTVQLPNGRQELTLSSGGKIATDMYIPTFGLTPNTAYIPSKFLNSSGSVLVNNYLRVPDAASVFAIGDVSALEPAQFLACDRQSSHLAKNIVAILSGKKEVEYKKAASRMLGLQVGKKVAVGHFGNYRIPGFLVLFMRKNLFVERLEPMVDGSQF